MNKNIEKEYKILLTKDQFTALTAHYPNLNFIRQINTYYDTEDMSIRASKGAMRIREKEGSFIFTLKKHSTEGLLEYECEVAANHSSIFEQEDIQALLNSYQIEGPLHQIAELITDRAAIDTGFAELCFDISSYNGITDYEIEYEYKKDHDGLSCFQKILEPIGVQYQKNCTSKIQRALNSML